MYCNMLKYNCTACNYVSTYYSTGGASGLYRYNLLNFNMFSLSLVVQLFGLCIPTSPSCSMFADNCMYTHTRVTLLGPRGCINTQQPTFIICCSLSQHNHPCIFFIVIPQTIIIVITITLLIFITDAIMSLPLTMAMTGIT